MSLGQLWAAVCARWGVVAGLVILATGLAVAITLISKPSYVASAQLVILPSPTELLRLADNAPDTDNLELKTQIDVMRSDRVILRAAERLNLATNKTFLQDYKEAKTTATLDQYAVEVFQKGLTILPGKESRVVKVMYEHTDPVAAALRANAIVDAFRDVNSELLDTTAKQSATDFNKRIDVTHLNNLSAELEAARSEFIQARARYAARVSGNNSVGGVGENLAMQALRQDESRAEADLQSAADRLGKEHPDYKERVARLSSIRSQIAMEIRRGASVLAADVQAAEKRFQEVQARFDAQRANLLNNKSEPAPANVDKPAAPTMNKDLAKPDSLSIAAPAPTGNEKAVNAATPPKSLKDAVGVMILQRAEPPYHSKEGQMRTNAIIGAILGLLLGVLGAALWELADLRVRSGNDIERWLDVPNLAAIPAFSAREARANARASRAVNGRQLVTRTET